MTILLRNNTKQVRDELKRIGFRVLKSESFGQNSLIILSTNKNVHPFRLKNKRKAIQTEYNNFTDCKTDKKMFINLAKKMMI